MIPLGVLASGQSVVAPGGVVVTNLGQVANGGTIVPSTSGGTFIFCFTVATGTQNTLSGLTYAGERLEPLVDRTLIRRAGSGVYAAPAVSSTISWTGAAYNLYVFHVNTDVVLSAANGSSPVASDGMWSLSLPGSQAGDLVFASVGVHSGGSASTLNSPLVVTDRIFGCHVGYGVNDQLNLTASGDIDPAQTNPAYTCVCVAAVRPHPGGAVTPDSLQGMRFWLEPSTLSGTEGSSVAAWNDTAGRAWSAGATQPTLTYAASGHAAVRFTGTELFFNNTVKSLSVPQTFFAVVRPSLNEATSRFVVGVSTGTGIALTLAALKPGLECHGGDWALARSADAAALGEWTVISGRYRMASQLEARLKNGTVTSATTTTNATSDRWNNIGGNAGAGSFKGDIAEIVHYDRALSNLEWSAVNIYLMTKYGVS